MSGRQSRTAQFVGKFWNLGKNEEDPRAVRKRNIGHLTRWAASLERYADVSERLACDLRQHVQVLRHERDAVRRTALIGNIRAAQAQRSELAGLIKSTLEKFRDLGNRELIFDAQHGDSVLRRAFEEASKRAAPLIAEPQSAKLPRLPNEAAATTHQLREELPAAGKETQSKTRITDFGAKLQAAVQAHDPKRNLSGAAGSATSRGRTLPHL